jgi:hypothetical protein
MTTIRPALSDDSVNNEQRSKTILTLPDTVFKDPTDIHSPHYHDRPPEWGSIPEEMLIRLAPRGTSVLTPDQRIAFNTLARGQWFLVRNEANARCSECATGPLGSPNRLPGAVHDYITTNCAELPFHGLRSILLWIGSYPTEIKEILWSLMRPGQGNTPGTIVPIKKRDADKLNARIRDRGGKPIDVQAPLATHEFDVKALEQKIRRQAHAPYRPERWY